MPEAIGLQFLGAAGTVTGSKYLIVAVRLAQEGE